MKQSLTFLFIICVNFLFGQEKAGIKRNAEFRVSKINIEVNHFKENKLESIQNLLLSEEIITMDFLTKNSSENKFLIPSIEDNPFLMLEIKEEKDNTNNERWLVKNTILLEEIILETQQNEHILYTNILDAYGDANLEAYRKHGTLNLRVKEDVFVKATFGQNILPFIYKQFKNNLDKNLTSSLNLAVLDF